MPAAAQVHCICSTEAQAMQVQQAHLADINSWQTCIYLSVRRYVPWLGRGLSGTRIKKWGRPGSGGRLGLGWVLTSLRASISKSASAFGYRQVCCGNSHFSHPPPKCPINAYDLQNGSFTTSKGIRPNSSPLEQSYQGFPPAITPTPGPSGAFSGSKLESIVVAALVLAFIEA